jgi:hypothetical protein
LAKYSVPQRPKSRLLAKKKCPAETKIPVIGKIECPAETKIPLMRFPLKEVREHTTAALALAIQSKKQEWI